MRQKREVRLLLVSELQRYNKGGESTAVFRGKLGSDKSRRTCQGQNSVCG